jgi:hypothetical protein
MTKDGKFVSLNHLQLFVHFLGLSFLFFFLL